MFIRGTTVELMGIVEEYEIFENLLAVSTKSSFEYVADDLSLNMIPSVTAFYTNRVCLVPCRK